MSENFRQLEYRDRISAIALMEKNDIGMLVAEGVAKPVHNGDGSDSPERSRRYCRVYNIYLSPALGPMLVRQKITVRLWYDEISGMACVKMGWKDFEAFYQMLFPHYKKNGKVGEKDMLWGEGNPVKVRVSARKNQPLFRSSW